MEIPTDVLNEILLNSTPETINKICQTHPRLNQLCNNENFWQQKLAKDYPSVDNKPVQYATWKQLYRDLYLHKIKYIPIFYDDKLLTYLWINASDGYRMIQHSIYELLPNIDSNIIHDFEYRHNGNNIINDVPLSSTIVDKFTPEYWYNHDVNLSINVIVGSGNLMISISQYGGWNQEDALVFNRSALDRGLFSSRTVRHRR